MKKQSKKAKSVAPIKTDGTPDTGQPVAQQSSTTSGKKWVYVTREDLMQALTPEQRKEVEGWLKAVGTPDAQAATLTPEQREQRDRYSAERWPLFDAKVAEFRKVGSETRYIQAIDAIDEFAEQSEWFAKHTPHPFKVSYWSYIPMLADMSCRHLQELALQGNEGALRDLAQLSVEMTETLTELLTGDPGKVKANARLMQHVAAELPYWPMLQFRHAAANNHFPLVADLLELGKECPINATGAANYSLQTPINQFVWRCLRHFQKVHRHIRWGTSHGKTVDDALAPLVFTKVAPPVARRRTFVAGMIHRQEIPIYRESFKLAPLTKGNARQWADVALMRYIRVRFPDLREVEELRYLKGKIGRTGTRYAPVRKAVIQALQQLARKS